MTFSFTLVLLSVCVTNDLLQSNPSSCLNGLRSSSFHPVSHTSFGDKTINSSFTILSHRVDANRVAGGEAGDDEEGSGNDGDRGWGDCGTGKGDNACEQGGGVGDGGGDGDGYLKKKTDGGHVCMTTCSSASLSGLQNAASVIYLQNVALLLPKYV